MDCMYSLCRYHSAPPLGACRIIPCEGVVTPIGPNKLFFFFPSKVELRITCQRCAERIVGFMPYDDRSAMSTSPAPQRSTAPPLPPPAFSSDESSEDEVSVVIVEDKVIDGPPKCRTTQGSALRNSTNKRKKATLENSTKTKSKARMITKDEEDELPNSHPPL